jgi:pimeloyl-ACP methyl ester carboxylesterase
VPATPVRQEVAVDGQSTQVSTAGPADAQTAVVFLHGYGGTGRYWHRLMAPVAEFARCVAPDMPGYGSASQVSGVEFTVDGYARYLDRLLDQLQVRRVHLVGHDLGVVWALAWGAIEPARVASLVEMNLGVVPGYRWHRYARMYRVPVLGELVLMSAYPRGVEGVLRRGSRSVPPRELVNEVMAQAHNPQTRRATLAFYRSVDDLGAVTVESAEALRDRDLPVLAIWGAGDPYVPASFAEKQRDYFPRAQVLVLPDSGHWPMDDDFDAVAGAVVPFLRRELTT